jgi:hypothetical protein
MDNVKYSCYNDHWYFLYGEVCCDTLLTAFEVNLLETTQEPFMEFC